MKCLYCDATINHYSLYDLFIERDLLCNKCRKSMSLKIDKFKLNDLECMSLYKYDSLFKSLLLQYKECYDEALSDVFLYKVELLIKLKYLDYKLVYVPSSIDKREKRGFDHLDLIFNRLGFEVIKGLRTKKEYVQVGKTKDERKQMLDNYYYEGDRINKLLIVDDVCTTGSSLLGVYNALYDKANHIKALVLARA